MSSQRFRQPLMVLLLLVGLPTGLAAQTLSLNTISTIAKSDPLVITGAVGTQNTYRYTSVGNGYASPLSNSIYANLNISVYGISMPFALYFTNDGLDWNYPHLAFRLTPAYKNWRGHFGNSTMAFSSYVMNTSFNGIGLEYNSDKMRFGAFYGVLHKAINDDPNDPFARTPQYKRVGWGFKAGYGSGKNYIDLYFLRAYDRPNSIDEAWRRYITPQENIVVGLKGAVAPLKWMSFSANAAVSMFSSDTDAPKVDTKQTQRWDKIMDVRYSSMARFAGDANVNFSLPGFSTSVTYRIVQPDYTSLGTYYMANNYHSLGVNMNGMLFKKVALSGTFSGQADNLTARQMYTTRGFIYSANASTRVGKNLSLAAGYNGYTQKQGDGTAKVNDSTRVHRRMASFTFTPSYLIESDVLGHAASLSVNYTSNKDLNKFAVGESDVKTLALGATYNLTVKPWQTDFGLTLSNQTSKGYKTKYTSRIATLSTGHTFFEENPLSLSGSISLVYNEVERQSKSLNIGGEVAASYTLKKYHVFSTSASFYKYGDVNPTKLTSNLDCTDITVSLNYAYTFSLLTIKKKNRKINDSKFVKKVVEISEGFSE
ncbi:MAG: hypothetical protein IJV08_11590 [Bacteroidaceae bacterium]|nr:hypothetical protein [Bacteroidaceae bacterium]